MSNLTLTTMDTNKMLLSLVLLTCISASRTAVWASSEDASERSAKVRVSKESASTPTTLLESALNFLGTSSPRILQSQPGNGVKTAPNSAQEVSHGTTSLGELAAPAEASSATLPNKGWWIGFDEVTIHPCLVWKRALGKHLRRAQEDLSRVLFDAKYFNQSRGKIEKDVLTTEVKSVSGETIVRSYPLKGLEDDPDLKIKIWRQFCQDLLDVEAQSISALEHSAESKGWEAYSIEDFKGRQSVVGLNIGGSLRSILERSFSGKTSYEITRSAKELSPQSGSILSKKTRRLSSKLAPLNPELHRHSQPKTRKKRVTFNLPDEEPTPQLQNKQASLGLENGPVSLDSQDRHSQPKTRKKRVRFNLPDDSEERSGERNT